MEYINSSLGIPVKGHFSDQYSSRFLNATGRKKTGKILLPLSPLVAGAYMALSGSDKKRYKDVMGNISNPPIKLIREYYNNTKSTYPFTANMTSEQLLSITDKLTAEYENWDVERDKKASLVAQNRKALDKGENKQTIAELAAVRSWMQAINDYRAEVIKAYDKAVAREDKEANVPPTSAPPPSNAPAPVGAGTGAEGVGGAVTDVASKLKDVASSGVNVGGKKIPVMTIALVAAGAGAVYYFFFRK